MNETIIIGIQGLVDLVNQSGGIPLTVTQVTKQNTFQFLFYILITSLLMFYMVFNMLRMKIKEGLAKLFLRIFVKRNKLEHIIVIKHTESSLFYTEMIDRRTLEQIQKALIEFKEKGFDLILYTPGGEIFSATYISRLLKNYKGKIRSIIPTFAMSGGTLLALSSDEIYMNDVSCLGAVDPQLGNLFRYGSAKSYKEILRIKGKKADDQTIAFKMIGEQYTKSIRENIECLLEGKTNKRNIKNLARLMTCGEIEHGFNMTKDFLRFNGLDIKDLDSITSNKLIKLIKLLPQGVTYI